MDVTRRDVVRLAMTGGAAVLARPAILRAEEGRELVVITYPGDLSKPHRWLADGLEKKHPGLTVRLVPSDSQDVVATIKAAQGYSPVDAMPNDAPPHLIGIGEGYIARRRDAALPNLGRVYPSFLAQSQGYGVPATYSLVGIAYNTSLIKDPPQTWADLWRPDLKGKVGIARTSNNLGLATLVMAAKTFGGSETDLDVGWDRLKALGAKAARSPASLTQMMEREEIALAPLWNNNTANLAGKGLPIAFAMPKPGAFPVTSFFSAITNTRYPDLVDEWMNGILSAEYQARAAAAPFFFGPTVKDVAIPLEAKAYTPSSPEEIAALQAIDWTEIVPIRGQLVDRFDRTFAM